MPRTFEDPNPHLSILDDGQVKKQIAEQARRALDMSQRQREAPSLSEEQLGGWCSVSDSSLIC